ncbi:UNVERIFIED_CONTAM: Anthocyanidin 3-O-glucosyltransferase 4 [Sesamum angustifolium]|uniref:Anthocyanidin 3-O-glucosyltransferase 4 n=1 Tax=Sesamum angustifolium TaxID=2727405 RepID=A0AAW2N4W8_9LAMI
MRGFLPRAPFVVPGLPDRIEFTRLQLPGLLNPGSTTDIESASNNDNLDKAQRGNQASIDTEQCLKWLDNRDPGSVVYACLGSLGRLSPGQFIELAVGLESSTHPFILVVKGGSRSEEIEKWIQDDGRIPDALWLEFDSQGISAGPLPMITWPIFAEQFLNEKLLVQILGTGVGVGAQTVTHLGEYEKDENKATRDGIKSAIERVMDKGKEGSERRKRAQELRVMAKRSAEVEGSSYLNVTMLIQEIAQLGKTKKGIA